MSVDFKPCPFCGVKVPYEHSSRGYFYLEHTPDCIFNYLEDTSEFQQFSKVRDKQAIEKAIEKWNHRPLEVVPQVPQAIGEPQEEWRCHFCHKLKENANEPCNAPDEGGHLFQRSILEEKYNG